jgi:hypothetical protein
MFYLEALINGFSSVFTYSNYTIFQPEQRRREHQPSFLRQIVFHFIFFVEFLGNDILLVNSFTSLRNIVKRSLN